MTTLLKLQEEFQQFILSDLNTVRASIVSSDKVAVDTRLTVYKDGYFWRLLDSLRANFPGLLLYLGDEEFENLGRAYIRTHPSEFRSIRWFGDKLAEFSTSYYEQEPSYIQELTDFEWYMAIAFDAADAVRLEVKDMMTIAPEQWASLCFSLHASVQRLDYFWNTPAVWKALIHDKALPSWQKTELATRWILWRDEDYCIQYYKLSDEEAWALNAIKTGSSFGELCEGLCIWLKEEDVAMHAASYLKGWIQKGMLVKK